MLKILRIQFNYSPEWGDKLDGDTDDDWTWCEAKGGDVDDDLGEGDATCEGATDDSWCDVTSFVMKLG